MNRDTCEVLFVYLATAVAFGTGCLVTNALTGGDVSAEKPPAVSASHDPDSMIIMWPEPGRPDFQEDDPAFDCRIDGDMVCGADDWWAVRFIADEHDRCMRGMIGLGFAPDLCEPLLTGRDS